MLTTYEYLFHCLSNTQILNPENLDLWINTRTSGIKEF